MLARIARGVRKHGPVGSVRAAKDVLIVTPLRRRRRRSEKPTLKELVRSTRAIEVRAEDLLQCLGHAVSEDLATEADAAIAEVERRTSARQLAFPERFAVERESGRLLYLLTRVVRPRLMVETGVANGASTLLILSALERNGSGMLVSVDVSSEVGSLLSEEEKRSPAWDLRLIRPDGLEEVLAELGPIDVFLHDSDHSYANVAAELATAWPRVVDGGLVLADDGELSCAFLDAASAHGVAPYGLFDRRKMFMVAVR